jgi:hypothetical protein
LSREGNHFANAFLKQEARTIVQVFDLSLWADPRFVKAVGLMVSVERWQGSAMAAMLGHVVCPAPVPALVVPIG